MRATLPRLESAPIAAAPRALVALLRDRSLRLRRRALRCVLLRLARRPCLLSWRRRRSCGRFGRWFSRGRRARRLLGLVLGGGLGRLLVGRHAPTLPRGDCSSPDSALASSPRQPAAGAVDGFDRAPFWRLRCDLAIAQPLARVHHELRTNSGDITQSDIGDHRQRRMLCDPARAVVPEYVPKQTVEAVHGNARVPHGHAVECVQSLVHGEDRRQAHSSDEEHARELRDWFGSTRARLGDRESLASVHQSDQRSR